MHKIKQKPILLKIAGILGQNAIQTKKQEVLIARFET